VLQQMATPPELGTADPFAAIPMHEVGGGGEGETAGLLGGGPALTEAQGQTEIGKGLLQPTAGAAIGLEARQTRRGPDQGIGEITGMEHGPATGGPTHHVDHPFPGQLPPWRLDPALVKPQGEGGPAPSIEADHRAGDFPTGHGRIEQKLIDRHLACPLEAGRRDPAHATLASA